MASDFGDDSGEKMVDWMLAVGQEAGDSAMCASAERLKQAFRSARGSLGDAEEASEDENLEDWVKLRLREFEELPEYETLREIIDEQLDRDAVEHDFFEDERGRGYLLFKREDADEVNRAFLNLEKRVDRALDESLQRRGKTREQVRDEEPLESRAQSARESSRAIDESRSRERDLERFEMRTK